MWANIVKLEIALLALFLLHLLSRFGWSHYAVLTHTGNPAPEHAGRALRGR